MDDETLATIVYVMLDNWYQRAGRVLVRSRPGPKPRCSDPEILSVALLRFLIGHGCSEAGFLAWLRRNHADWFPHLPDDGQFHHRSRKLLPLLDAFFTQLSWGRDLRWCLLDTSALPVVRLARATRRKSFRDDQPWAAGRDFMVTTKAIYYGYKLVLLTDLQGCPVRIGLVPADTDDPQIAQWALAQLPPGWRLADKGFNNLAVQAELATQGHYLLVPPKRGMRAQWPKLWRDTFGRVRRRIETTGALLKDYFGLERHRMKTFRSLALQVLACVVACCLRLQFGLGR